MTDPVFHSFDAPERRTIQLSDVVGHPPSVVYVVEMIESERGYGQRPDGYLLFRTENAASLYVKEETKGYTGPAPDVYVRYNMLGYKEACQAIMDRFSSPKRNMLYIDRLHELQNYDSKKYL